MCLFPSNLPLDIGSQPAPFCVQNSWRTRQPATTNRKDCLRLCHSEIVSKLAVTPPKDFLDVKVFMWGVYDSPIYTNASTGKRFQTDRPFVGGKRQKKVGLFCYVTQYAQHQARFLKTGRRLPLVHMFSSLRLDKTDE